MQHELLLHTDWSPDLIEQRTVGVAEGVPAQTGNSHLFTPRLKNLPLDDSGVVAASRNVRSETSPVLRLYLQSKSIWANAGPMARSHRKLRFSLSAFPIRSSGRVIIWSCLTINYAGARNNHLNYGTASIYAWKVERPKPGIACYACARTRVKVSRKLLLAGSFYRPSRSGEKSGICYFKLCYAATGWPIRQVPIFTRSGNCDV